jgi:hypothetical protein
MVTTKGRNSGGTSIGRALGKGTKGTTSTIQKGKIATIKQDGKSHAAIERSRSVSPIYTKEQLEEAEGRQSLDPNNSRYNALWKETQEKMGMPKHKPSKYLMHAVHILCHFWTKELIFHFNSSVHSEDMNRIQLILRVFDLDPS